MVATEVTLNDLEGHSPVADVFTCNPSNTCAAFYTISTDSVLARFLWISRASCQWLSHKTAIIFQLTYGSSAIAEPLVLRVDITENINAILFNPDAYQSVHNSAVGPTANQS